MKFVQQLEDAPKGLQPCGYGRQSPPGALYSFCDRILQSTSRRPERKVAGSTRRLLGPCSNRSAARGPRLYGGLAFSRLFWRCMRAGRLGAAGTFVNESSDRDDAHLNRSLDDVVALLEREIERLEESLET